MRVQLSFNIRELTWKQDLETKMPTTIFVPAATNSAGPAAT